MCGVDIYLELKLRVTVNSYQMKVQLIGHCK